eukprot:550990-Pyramimonas_sp.AAC.1
MGVPPCSIWYSATHWKVRGPGTGHSEQPPETLGIAGPEDHTAPPRYASHLRLPRPQPRPQRPHHQRRRGPPPARRRDP